MRQPSRIAGISLISIIRRLKKTAQLAGVFPPDPDLTTQAQELFEQFFEAYESPNDAEKDLLAEAGGVSVEIVEDWCKWYFDNNLTITELD